MTASTFGRSRQVQNRSLSLSSAILQLSGVDYDSRARLAYASARALSDDGASVLAVWDLLASVAPGGSQIVAIEENRFFLSNSDNKIIDIYSMKRCEQPKPTTQLALSDCGWCINGQNQELSGAEPVTHSAAGLLQVLTFLTYRAHSVVLYPKNMRDQETRVMLNTAGVSRDHFSQLLKVEWYPRDALAGGAASK